MNKQATGLATRPWQKHLPFLGAIGFVVCLLVIEEFVFRFRFVDYLQRLSTRPWTTLVPEIAFFSAYIFLLLIYCVVMVHAQTVWRILLGFLLVVGLTIQYGYWKAYASFMTAADIYTAFRADTSLWQDAIGGFFNWWTIIPVLLLVGLLFLTRGQQQWGVRTVAVLFTAVVMFFFFSQAVGFGHTFTVSFFRFYRTLVVDYLAQPNQYQTYERQLIDYRASTPPDNNIILIVDESIRGDHLSINGYERATTPFLETIEEEGLLFNWGIASAAATVSIQSNSAMMVGVPELPDIEQNIWRAPNMFQYAQAMGYKTYFFDAQADFLWTGLTISDLNYIDQRMTATNLGDDLERDFVIAQQVAELLANDTGYFVVINKKGVHYPYYKSYPESATIWTPIVTDLSYDDYDGLRNSFDNGVRYAVDRFFEVLLADKQFLQNSVILYTADHGQTLSQNGEPWAHGRYTKAEATVPLVMITGMELTPDTAYKASHFNIFPTLLDLMQVPEVLYALHYQPSLLEATAADSMPRYYLEGRLDIFSATSEPLPFDE